MRIFPGADCKTDHELLVMDVRIKLKKLKQSKRTPKTNTELLADSSQLKLKLIKALWLSQIHKQQQQQQQTF